MEKLRKSWSAKLRRLSRYRNGKRTCRLADVLATIDCNKNNDMFEKQLSTLEEEFHCGANANGSVMLGWLGETCGNLSTPAAFSKMKRVLELSQSFQQLSSSVHLESTHFKMDEKTNSFYYGTAKIGLLKVTKIDDLLALEHEFRKDKSVDEISMRWMRRRFQDQSLYSLALDSNAVLVDAGLFCRNDPEWSPNATPWILPCFCALNQFLYSETVVRNNSPTTVSKTTTRVEAREPNVVMLHVSARARRMGIGRILVKLLNIFEVKNVLVEAVPFWYSCGVKINSFDVH